MRLETVEDVLQLIRDEISYQYEVADVAESAGVARSTVMNIVKGKTKSPHFRTIIAILKAMEFNIQVKGDYPGRRLPASTRERAYA
jgi:DNA-binding phage protein